jgi:hypothetical protein
MDATCGLHRETGKGAYGGHECPPYAGVLMVDMNVHPTFAYKVSGDASSCLKLEHSPISPNVLQTRLERYFLYLSDFRTNICLKVH